ncbi:DUF438 domain-containing protein [Thermococcus argininiproducens]|uniref:DUF438 domain-containing protein n=1 Tax=Thermococcus argininiproducens TaxID=2866384 RepID=A0A9E7MA78_9EURY|nr:DUF438 domain-containing protein [Thermococcus argininiproducens]USH00181.1 DUF438 domain-containing protein [Thermococcus argininiproducens]
MTELLKNREYKKEKMKELLRKIHRGEDVEKLKEEFKDLLRNISPLEIPLIEQELVKEGISAREIAKMCDIHVELFREAVAGTEREEMKDIPPVHPLYTLYEENREIIKDAEMLNLYASTLANTKDERMREEILGVLKGIANQLRAVGFTHYNREEMLIFPYLERRGITAVPTVLWTKHDETRGMIKQLLEILNKADGMEWEEFTRALKEKASELSNALVDMVFRENNILYPTLRALLSEGEWVAIKQQEEAIGYYKVKPGDEWKPEAKPLHPYEIDTTLTAEQILSLPKEVQMALRGQKLEGDRTKVKREGDLELETGYLSPKEINAIFKHLPVDVTFIDKDDRVRFFSGGDRIFTRTPSVIGRPVQLCHPPKSVSVVDKILKAFKEGKKDAAEFWIQMGGKFIYIKYVPVRDEKGEYLGTLEITQEISRIKALEGEKRLLDWRD